MSTDLATILQSANALSNVDDKQFSELAKTSDYLCRIQLCGANSELVKSGKIPMAHWVYMSDKENPVDLGPEFELLPLSLRACASSLGGEKVITVYDMNDALFQEFKDKSAVKDSQCVYGPEFLVYIPSIDKFATYHMNSITARKESPKLKALLGKGALLKAKYIKTAKYSWHGPDIYPCSTPLKTPETDTIMSTVNKFLNPPKSEVVAAPADTSARER